MNYCKQCVSEFEGKGNVCPVCVEALKVNKAQAKKSSKKDKVKSEPKTKPAKEKAPKKGK